MNEKINYLRSVGVDVDTAVSNMIDIETYNEILDDFYNSFEEEIEKINNYKNQNDMSNYAILVHAMKSNARSFGFMKFGEICYNHEMASKQNDIDYVNLHYNEFLDAAKEVYQIITKYKSM